MVELVIRRPIATTLLALGLALAGFGAMLLLPVSPLPNIDIPTLVVQANISYGGVKNSGLGKEACLEAMLEHFTHKKTIMVNYA